MVGTPLKWGLMHGVQYFQQSVSEPNCEQHKLVEEALHEYEIFLQTTPYLFNTLPVILHLYK